MPDLLTHAATAYLLKRVLSPRRHLVPFLLGSALPDLVSYLPLAITSATPVLARELAQGTQVTSTALPLWIEHVPEFFYPFHGILPFLLLCGLLAFLVPAADRRGVFLNLLLGGLLHLGMDLLQVNHHQHSYLLFPFSWRAYSLGWIGTESSLSVAPFLCAACAAFLVYDHRKRKALGIPGEPANGVSGGTS